MCDSGLDCSACLHSTICAITVECSSTWSSRRMSVRGASQIEKWRLAKAGAQEFGYGALRE